jgi:hypothetical protein
MNGEWKITDGKYILYDNIYCDCCAKCIGLLRKECYIFYNYQEFSKKILELKNNQTRHKVWSIEDGKEQVFFDNILTFFH